MLDTSAISESECRRRLTPFDDGMAVNHVIEVRLK
jgi:hypothetical protein